MYALQNKRNNELMQHYSRLLSNRYFPDNAYAAEKMTASFCETIVYLEKSLLKDISKDFYSTKSDSLNRINTIHAVIESEIKRSYRNFTIFATDLLLKSPINNNEEVTSNDRTSAT